MPAANQERNDDHVFAPDVVRPVVNQRFDFQKQCMDLCRDAQFVQAGRHMAGLIFRRGVAVGPMTNENDVRLGGF